MGIGLLISNAATRGMFATIRPGTIGHGWLRLKAARNSLGTNCCVRNANLRDDRPPEDFRWSSAQQKLGGRASAEAPPYNHYFFRRPTMPQSESGVTRPSPSGAGSS